MTTEALKRTMTTLVIGGTGKTGRRVAERLTARDVPVRIGSRSAETPFDWEDPATWEPALKGMDAVYISYYPDMVVPGAVDSIRTLSGMAREAGVQRLVLLSGRGEEAAQDGERVVQESGLEWTVVRSAWFSQNFSENFFLDPILSGAVALPIGDVLEPFVDADDLADVAVAALTEQGHSGQIYELTGPRLLTFEQAVDEIARATGREIRFQGTSMDEYTQVMEREGVPEEFVGLLTYLFTEVLDGRNAWLADGVQRVLGREPKDFTAYARETAATGIWSV